MAADVGRIQIEAHWYVAALACKLQRIGALREAGHPDWRGRRLQWLDVRFEEPIHQLWILHGPVLACISKWLIGRPKLQDDIKRLAHHEAIDPVRAIDVEHLPIARQAARRDAEVEPPARDMVED